MSDRHEFERVIERRLDGIESALQRIERNTGTVPRVNSFSDTPAGRRLNDLTAELEESQRRRTFGTDAGEIVRVFNLPSPDGGSETYFDLYEIAKRIHVSYETVRRWVSAGELPARKIGRRRIVSRTDLARFLEARP